MYSTYSGTFDIDSCMIARVGPFSSDANAGTQRTNGTQARCQSKRREEGTRAISCVQEMCYLKLLSTVIHCTYIVYIFPAQPQSVNFSSVFFLPLGHWSREVRQPPQGAVVPSEVRHRVVKHVINLCDNSR